MKSVLDWLSNRLDSNEEKFGELEDRSIESF